MKKFSGFLLLGICCFAHAKLSAQTCYPTTNREASGYHSNLYIAQNPRYPFTSDTANILYAWGQDACTFTGTPTTAPNTYNNGTYWDLCVPSAISGFSGIPVEVRGASNGGGGKDFYVLRTSTNLYLFGDANFANVTKGGLGNGVLTNAAANIASTSSSANLPTSFNNIAFMQIADSMLAIVTIDSGTVWINGKSGTKSGTSYYGNQYGDGGASTNLGNSNGWHEVMLNSTTKLQDVAYLSLANDKAAAVTSKGAVYFWGAATPTVGTTTNASYASLISTTSTQLPSLTAGATVSQVVVLGLGRATSMFLLTSDGHVYATGDNSQGQLGTGNTTSSYSATFKYLSGLQGVIKIDGSTESCSKPIYAIGALSSTKILYLWGGNNGNLTGGSSSNNTWNMVTSAASAKVNDTTGMSNPADTLSTPSYDFNIGGHFTISFDGRHNFYDYLGHYVDGSMGNNNCAGNINETVLLKVAAIGVSFSCSVATPTIVANDSLSSVTLSSFIACAGSASPEQSFKISGSNLTDSLRVIAPAGYQITTTSGSNYTSYLAFKPTAGNVSDTTIYIELAASAPNGASGNIIDSSLGAATVYIATGAAVVNPLPTVVAANGASRVGPGTVNLSGTASGGATLDWYASNSPTDTILAGGIGTLNFTTPSISTTTNYFVQARNITTGCISAGRTIVTATIDAAMPVSLIGFNARKQEKNALLTWSTASEQNSKDFLVQTSIDGQNWSTIGSVPAAGFSNSVLDYSFVQTNPQNGINFYRLLQEDIDNRISYSNTISISFSSQDNGILVYPNPNTDGILNIYVPKTKFISLYDNVGRLLFRRKFNSGLQHMDVSKITKGVYLLKSDDETIKIIIQ